MAQAELEVLTEVVDGITVVTLSGPIDSATFDEFKAAMHPLTRGEIPLVVLDCSQLSYINSKGIGLFASFHRQTMLQLGYAAFCGLSSRIRKTMELLGLGKRLHVFETREEAIAAVVAAKEAASG